MFWVNRSIWALASVLTVSSLSDAHAEVQRWVCRFDIIASPEGLTNETFRLGFAYDGDGYKITFSETLPTGAVQTTTITRGGSSVHSRDSMTGEELIPSRFGCRIEPEH